LESNLDIEMRPFDPVDAKCQIQFLLLTGEKLFIRLNILMPGWILWVAI